MAGSGTPFLLQLAEGLGALSVPIGTGLGTWARWQKSAARDRRAREEAARIASEKAAADARKDEQLMRDKLLAEKDGTINRLAAQLVAEQTENERLHRAMEKWYREGKGDANDNG